ncbi:hypothetical protein HOP50_17g79850 [Chloropicon primus]|uniref:Uncharacterized protein n=1 Tax=Chloropicon primus TaxID=1764295 RepID=A0A5B8N0L1_9CHLO|nr:hypothetical protein A3770_17p79630 [Chloropicon primus]UPR04641.1 hypothetical protein HOP50_17g79850 [Chloropicon primus]|mmetsp:Transcript_13335/g.37431  ORF Transcript_13335/g.37431 Transcript_13335/m.37431 type:complete len:451 (+) Transcript_13335:175-1527(+)|eukprot:QDZ25445.1 hypothetical protein A3770_17p79630 [Chloropicon primus]
MRKELEGDDSPPPRGFQNQLKHDNEVLNREKWQPGDDEFVTKAKTNPQSLPLEQQQQPKQVEGGGSRDRAGLKAVGHGEGLASWDSVPWVGIVTFLVVCCASAYLYLRGAGGLLTGTGRVVVGDDATSERKKRKRARNRKNRAARKATGGAVTSVQGHGGGGLALNDASAPASSTAVDQGVVETVASLARGLGLNPAELDPKTKLQLVQTALNSEALKLRREQKDVAGEAHRLNLSREEKRCVEEEVFKFKASCADSLVAGILVTFLCIGVKAFDLEGQWTSILEACPAGTGPGEGGERHSWFPFAVPFLLSKVEILNQALCLLKVTLSRVGGYLVAAYFLAKFFHHVASLAVTYHRAPITVILLLLGLGMGSALNVLVSAWGGSGTLFFSVWMVLCALHCVLVTRAQTIVRLLGRERIIPWKHFALHVVLIVVLPATAGLLPFQVVSYF